MNDGLYGLPGLRPDVVAGPWGNANISLKAVPNGTQLVISARARDGSVLGSGGGSVVAFPNADQSIGDTKLKTIAQPVQPLVIASGSTMGFSNAAAGRLWVVLVDDIAGPALGVINCLSGINIYPLGQDSLLTSLALSGGASAAHQFYSARAITSRPYIILGYLTWESALVTAGTWDAKPSRARLYGPGVKLPGTVAQVQTQMVSATSAGPTTTPNNNNIPQISQGVEFFSQAIAPTSGANVLEFDASGHFFATGGNAYMAMALFQGATADALAASGNGMPTDTGKAQIALFHARRAGTTSATTFTVRVGQNSVGTIRINSFDITTQAYGGVSASHFRIIERVA
jgi:hypothetical protein